VKFGKSGRSLTFAIVNTKSKLRGKLRGTRAKKRKGQGGKSGRKREGKRKRKSLNVIKKATELFCNDFHMELEKLRHLFDFKK